MNNSPIEIERKYLIRYPDTEALAAMDGARVLHLRQTYLLAPRAVTVRVRRIEENGNVRYIRTEKRRISDLSAYEYEQPLSEAEYEAMLVCADPDRRSIEKTRYVIPHGNVFCEIDVYPFWEDRAILEIELSGENEHVTLPDWLTVVREVTGDRRYSNSRIAKKIPQDELND